MSRVPENLRELVYNYPVKNTESGFTDLELKEFIKQFEDINIKKVDDAMFGNICACIDDEIVNYFCDVLTAVRCGLENRDINFAEFD